MASVDLDFDKERAALDEEGYQTLLQEAAVIKDGFVYSNNNRQLAQATIHEEGISISLNYLSPDHTPAFIYTPETGELKGLATGTVYEASKGLEIAFKDFDLGGSPENEEKLDSDENKPLNEDVSIDSDPDNDPEDILDKFSKESVPNADLKENETKPSLDEEDLDDIIAENEELTAEQLKKLRDKEEQEKQALADAENAAEELEPESITPDADAELDDPDKALESNIGTVGDIEGDAENKKEVVEDKAEVETVVEEVVEDKAEVETVVEEVVEDKAEVETVVEEVETEVEEDLDEKKDEAVLEKTTIGGVLSNLAGKALDSAFKGFQGKKPSQETNKMAVDVSNKKSSYSEAVAEVGSVELNPTVTFGLTQYEQAMLDYQRAYSDYLDAPALGDLNENIAFARERLLNAGMEPLSNKVILNAMAANENNLLTDVDIKEMKTSIERANKDKDLQARAQNLRKAQAAALVAAEGANIADLASGSLESLSENEDVAKIKDSIENIEKARLEIGSLHEHCGFTPGLEGAAITSEKGAGLLDSNDQQGMMEEFKRAMENISRMLDNMMSKFGMGSA